MLSLAGGLYAQDAPENDTGAEVKTGPLAGGDATVPVPRAQATMPAKMSLAEEQATNDSAAAGLASNTATSVLTAGLCPVVDSLVQQFCATNPDDISCQLQ